MIIQQYLNYSCYVHCFNKKMVIGLQNSGRAEIL
jgi:hypothetical protein